MARLLVIVDDHDLAFGIAAALQSGAHETIIARDGEDGLALSLTEPSPALVILDLALCEPADFRMLRRLRERGYDGPILVASAHTDEADRVQAFRLGADQYMTKPFGVLELVARVDLLLARSSVRNGAGSRPRVELQVSRYVFGDVVVEPATRQVYRGGAPVKLAPMEFDLLMALLRRRGAATARRDLLREVWKYGPDVMSRTLDTHILHLREKLEDEPSIPRHILTVRKLGYRLHC